ncbi:MAG: hypothetical protein AB8A42_05720, partial [Prochlorococcus sp.]
MTLATEPVTAVGPRRPAAFAMRLATDVEAIPPLAPLALRARRAGRAVPTDVLEAFLADLAADAFLAGALAADAFLAGAFVAGVLLVALLEPRLRWV